MAAASTYISTATNTVNQTIHDFGNFNAGGAGVLFAVAAFYGGNQQTVSSVSIDGSTTGVTIHVSNPSGTGAEQKYVIASKTIASGGNKNITVTLSGATGGFASATCSGFLVTGAAQTIVSGGSVSVNGNPSAGPAALSVNTQINGIEFYAYASPSNRSITGSTATLDYSASVNTSWHTHGHRLSSTTQTPHAESWTLSGSGAWSAGGAALQPSNVATTSVINPGTFTLTGKGLNAGKGRSMGKGIFTFTGRTIGWRSGHGRLMGVGAFTLTGKTILGHITMFGRMTKGAFALTGKDIGFRRHWRLVMGSAAFLAKGGWHSMRLDSTATTTNRIVNRKWWAGLLNGGR